MGEALAVPDKAKRASGAGTRARFRAADANIDKALRRRLETLGSRRAR